MVIYFPGFYIKLYVICIELMVIFIELYTYNPDTYSYAYISSATSVTSLYKKTKVCHGQTFIRCI